MKRGTLLLLISLVLVLSLDLSSALLTSCSDNSTLTTDTKEIEEGKVKSVNGLYVGVERADDAPVFRKIFADLLLDAQVAILENNVSANVSISSASYTISLVSATDTRAVIRVNSANSDEIEEGDSETVSGLIVSLKSATRSGDISRAEILVGVKRVSLSSDKLYEKQTINNVNYLIKLISASDTNAIVEVQKCATGEIQVTEEQIQQTQQNQTSNNTTSNQTTSNQTETENADDTETENNNESSRQVTVAEVQERLRQMQEANNTNQSADSQEGTAEKKPGFFKRFINWIKRLLTFDD